MTRLDTSAFVRGAIKHKKFVYLIALAFCIVGFIGLWAINKDEFPSLEIKQGLVVGVYPGADAEEVENRLSKPLEDVLLGIPEVNRDNLNIVSNDGIAYLFVDLTCSQQQKTEVWSKIKHRLNQSKILLPPGVLTVQVIDDFSDISAILLALESDDKGWSEMQDYADDLKERLRKIDRLGSVSTIGEQSEEIAVTIDMARLSSYGVSPASLMLSYASSGLNLPSGTFNTNYTSSPIAVEPSCSTEEEVANRIVYCDKAGNSIRLKDIATVERRMKAPSKEVRHNGKTAILLNIVMRPDNNIVAFGKDVDKVLEEFSATLPESVHISRVSDQPKVVDKSVMGFLRDLLISMMVVILVMIVMFPMRSALIASSGVPVCTMITIAVMFMTGMCLNTVTLAALIVVLGMIVDDSIITMDGYMDNLSHGMDRVDAAASSAKSLFMPMFMATLSICSMFFPMLGIITGYLGEFIKSFPWIILIALMTSLVYAIAIVPSLETRFIHSAHSDSNGFTAKLQNGMFKSLQNAYDKVQAIAFRHPWATIGIGLGTILLGVLMFSQLNVQMMPYAARNSFAVEIYLEPGHNYEDTKAVADSMERMLIADPRIIDVTSFIGTGAPRYHCTYTPKMPAPTFAQLIVTTKSEIATEEILPYAEAKYEHYFPQALIHVKQMDYQGTDSSPVAVIVSGPEREKFIWVADSIQNYMMSLDRELKWVHRNSGDYVNKINVSLDTDQAARLGVDKTLLSLSLAQNFSSSSLVTLYEGGNPIPVNLYGGAVSDTMSYETISNQLISTLTPGVSVPLRQVAEIHPEWKMKSLVRYAGEENIGISADLKYGHSHPPVMKKVDAYVKGLCERNGLPEGVHIKYGGLSATNETIGVEIAFAFISAVAIMFLFLLLHFRKISLTILSLSLSLLCLFGASFGLWAFNLDFGMTSVLGIVSLIGIIVRNGIIMFEYAEELHFKDGHSVKEAAMLAGQRRMRPIFLTSCTTALGVLPMIISGDALWQPMGLVICSGIVFSILLVVFVMPVSYWKVFERN